MLNADFDQESVSLLSPNKVNANENNNTNTDEDTPPVIRRTRLQTSSNLRILNRYASLSLAVYCQTFSSAALFTAST